MTRDSRPSPTSWRHVWLTLAMVAVAVRVMIPAGFMVAAPSNDLPFPIVLCTGSGMVSVEPGSALTDRDGKGKAPAQDAHDSPCAFTGHGVAAPPPAVADASAPVFVDYAPRLSATPEGLIPGRGLTGPPLPARGPPTLLI